MRLSKYTWGLQACCYHGLGHGGKPEPVDLQPELMSSRRNHDTLTSVVVPGLSCSPGSRVPVYRPPVAVPNKERGPDLKTLIKAEKTAAKKKG